MLTVDEMLRTLVEAVAAAYARRPPRGAHRTVRRLAAAVGWLLEDGGPDAAGLSELLDAAARSALARGGPCPVDLWPVASQLALLTPACVPPAGHRPVGSEYDFARDVVSRVTPLKPRTEAR